MNGPKVREDEKQVQLAAEIGQLQAELVPIEKALGLNQECEEAMPKVATYTDVPRRLEQLIVQVQDLSGRLADVKAVVLNLEESVG